MEAFQRLSETQAQRIVDVVHGSLRRAIIRHEVEPGFHLSVPALAMQFGVSRSPVREAVQRLVSEGLAVELPRRGAYVTNYDVAKLLPLYQVRLALDGMAARLAAGNMTSFHVERIKKVLKEEGQAIKDDDLGRHIETDIEFHSLMIACAGNSVLTEILQKVYDQIRSAMMARVVLTGPRLAYRDHLAIFKAARSGNVDAAESAARAHVERVIQKLRPG